jgi:hypothetical protein
MPSSPCRRLGRLVRHVIGAESRSLHPAAAAGAPAGFELVLEQGADLAVTTGSAAQVASALSRGADLRLYMATNDDSAEQPGGSKGMAKSKAYEETLYFLQTSAAWAAGSSSDGEPAAPAFAGMCPHHTSFVHEGAKPEQPYFSLFRYDTSGTYSQIKWMKDRVIDASQACAYLSTSALCPALPALPALPCPPIVVSRDAC